MADSKITALTSISTSTDPAVDPLVIVDVSDTSMAASGTSKKVTLNNLLSSSPTATGAFTVTGLVTAGSATITGDLTVRTNKLAVTSTGVGCGTATPTGVADFLSAVVGNSNVLTIGNNEYGASTYLNSNSVSLTFNRGPSFKTGAVVSSNITSGNLSEGYIALQTSTGNVLTERYRIDNAGNSIWSVAGTTAMTLNSTGLGIGGSAASKLSLTDTSPRINFVTTVGLDVTGYIYNAIDVGSGGKLVFGTKRNGDTALDRLTIDSSGNVSIGDGNLVMSTSGKGIDFSAKTPDGSGTVGSEVLNDYEEGTFTPVISGSTAAGVGTYSEQVGRYTKVGRIVTVDINLTWSAHTGTGNMRIDGLPFSSNSVSAASGSIGILSNIAMTANYIATAYNYPSSTLIFLLQYATGGSAAISVPMDAAGAITVSMSYTV